MATIHLTDPWDQEEQAHPYLTRCFTVEQRRQMRRDDSEALTRVSMLLLSIVAGGLALGIIAIFGMACAIVTGWLD